jgi:hypothetical protein
MGFYPEGYELPTKESDYMNPSKFEDGVKVKFRILSDAAMGWEFWSEKKPYRFRTKKEAVEAPNYDPQYYTDEDGEMRAKNPIKHYWALAVWDYEAKAIKLLQINQATIQTPIDALMKDEDWGRDPKEYDISITRTGKGTGTKYAVTPSNKSKTDPDILEAYKAKPINLDALLVDGDPFAPGKPVNSDPLPTDEEGNILIQEIEI